MAEFDRGADGIAQFLLDLGTVQQDKVAIYLYNSPEYLQTTFAAVKVGLVPVNTNYRYGDDELSYLWENADAVAVVFHGAFTDRIEGILDRVPGVQGLALGRRRLGTLSRLGHALRGRRQVRHSRVPRTVGAQRRRPLHALHRRHHRHAQGRDVAPGRSLRPADRQRAYATTRSTAASRPCAPRSRPARAASPSCRPARSCTAPATSPSNTVLAEGGRVCLLESRQLRPGGAARHH